MNKPLSVMQIIGGGEFFGRRLPIGGAAQYVFLLLRSLDPAAFRPTLVFFYNGPSARQAREAGYRVHVVAKKLRKDPSLPFRLAALMRREGTDVVSTHLTDADFYGRLAGKLARVSGTVSTMHSFISGTTGGAAGARGGDVLRWWHEVKLSRLSERIVTVCRALAEEMAARGVDPQRLVTIPPGVDAGRFEGDGAAFRKESGFDAGHRIIGTIGRLAPSKNYAAFLEAAAGLSRQDERLRFVIAGDGPEMASLRALAQRLGIADQTVFTGWRQDTERLLPAFDIFCLTSQTEAMPITIIEAMAAGALPVVPAVGGIPEAVRDGVNGFLYPPGDYASFGRILRKVLDDGTLSRTMLPSMRATVSEHYSLARMGEATAEVYRQALAARRPRTAR